MKALRCAAVVAAVLAAAASASAQDTVPGRDDPAQPELITRADAMLVAEAAIKSCEKRGEPASAVVIDAKGFERVAYGGDHSRYVAISAAFKKAEVVLVFKEASHIMKQRIATDPQFAAQYEKDPRYSFSPGGLPIYRNGVLVAALGVGGARTYEQECAFDALKVLKWATTAPRPPAPAPAK